MTRDEVTAYIQDVHFGYLATTGTDGAPRVRPVGMHTIYGDCLYFFTFGNTRKVAELEVNPQVEVVWCKPQQQSQVRIRGRMLLEENEAIHQQFKQDNPMVARMLPQEAQHLFRLYRLQPEAVEMPKGWFPIQRSTGSPTRSPDRSASVRPLPSDTWSGAVRLTTSC
jgi:uncharacterized pyridoxamine 5'-phosphate oxidase family protein